MRKLTIMLAVCLALLLAGGPAAFCQQDFVSRYSSCEKADSMRIGRKSFYSIISVSGYDKETRQLMKNLNVGHVTYLNMMGCADKDRASLDTEIREAVASGKYVAMDSTSVEQGRLSMLFCADNGHIKQVLMYTPDPAMSLIQIQCYASLDALTSVKAGSKTKKE